MMSVSKPCILTAALFFSLLYSFKLGYCIGNSSLIVCPEIEKQSLLSFKQSLQDPSSMLSSWNNGTQVNCCKWKGVFCSNLTGHVHQLHLQSDYNLSGKINPFLLNLKHLKYLDLSRNHFEETIPSFIGSLRSLEYLNLSNAGFYGKIPHTIGNLSNLHTLGLQHNSLDVDSLEWLSGLSKLEYLNMNYVNLSKAANWQEHVINKLPSLVELHFRYCSLNSDFSKAANWPEQMNINGVHNITTSNLAILDLSRNDFESFLPKWVFRLSNLIFLDLGGNNFEGTIPTITNTTKLKHIDLSNNNFNSSIPEWLYSCNNLQFLNLGSNALQNAISNSIGNLSSLNTLDISYNELSGKIPREIGSLCKIQKLDLVWNKLQGEISDSFGNMSDCFLGALESIYLSYNELSGHLTHQFGEFKSLRTLNFRGNSLSGVIPNNIGNLSSSSSLERLYLDGNTLTGNLPESVGQLLNLKELHIQDNMLEGVVTETHFAHLSKLTALYASGNHLTLKVSPNWIPPFKLEGLQLGSWNLGSPFPSWLESQKKNILGVDLSNTGIYGNVPSWIWSINLLNLSHNQLHGKIPLISGSYVYLSSNKFSGPLPQIGNLVFELDLSNNSFSGYLSHFLCHTTMTNETNQLRILHLGGNHLTGELPDCWMKWPSLRLLNIGNNNLSGRIPNSIGFLTNILSLSLYSNKFSGQIPFPMQNCTKLLKMDLADNDFDGSIPTWIGASLSNLRFLVLRSNKWSGQITSAICQLSSLQILDLSDNRFSGMIPRCVNNFTAMTTKGSLLYIGSLYYSFRILESASITTKGREFTYDTILPLVTNIDFSRNNLSGHIPKEITSLVELRSLNLSGNHLTGLIPDSTGSMKQLESLDFSINSMSGEIPSSFTIMSSLNFLNLSYNNLTGKIPQSTQILGFKNSSFVGNNLCGPPLTISCSNELGKSPGPTHAQDQDQEGDKSEIEWLYVFISLGYAVGLSAFITTFFLKKSWREAYYEFLEDIWDSVYVYFYIKWRRITRALGRNT